MWEWVHFHHDDLQALGPLATIFAAIIAVLVTGALGLAQWRIARAQKDIAYDKLRLDLFDKRYAVYQAAQSLSRALMPSYKRIPYEEFGALQYTLQEAEFLFSSEVVSLTNQIKTLSFDWENNVEVLGNVDNPPVEELRNTILRRQQEIPREMSKLRIRVEGVFRPELAFKQLTQKQ